MRDYRIWSNEEKGVVIGGSAFNIKSESLKIPTFTFDQVKDLYLQHTAETGQKFAADAIEYAFEQTQGQPWLANALAYEACFRDVKDRSQSITRDILIRARETVIERQDIHLDVIIHKLEEPRIRNIVDRVISGVSESKPIPKADRLYAIDMGILCVNEDRVLDIANPIYREIIPRVLSEETQSALTDKTIWYQNEDKSLNMKKLLEAFTQFYRENAEFWLKGCDYKESAPHLLMMAFLQRIVNGGGRIDREYALGRRRVDLLVWWPVGEGDLYSAKAFQRIVIELKVRLRPDFYEKGLEQTADYMDKSDATEGHLIIFDRDMDKPWDEKIYQRVEGHGGKTINIWAM